MNNFFLKQVSEIDNGLFLSSLFAASKENIKKFDISCVITVCKEAKHLDFGKNVEIVRLNLVDSKAELLINYFDSVADKIRDVKENNGKCLVHCMGGISRSPTMVIAYLMKHCKMSLREAFSLVKSKRKYTKPNTGFWYQLIDYEKQIHGLNTVKMIQMENRVEPDVYTSSNVDGSLPRVNLKEQLTNRLITFYSSFSSTLYKHKLSSDTTTTTTKSFNDREKTMG